MKLKAVNNLSLVALAGIVMTGCGNEGRSSRQLPNVVIIFADDLGYGDIGCFGSDNPTPNIDRMAEQGMRFTDFYVAQPVCGASRAALLTGCYPNRVGIYGAPGPTAKTGINPGEMTIAELLKQKEYATAMYGKWHLGHLKPFLPVHHGFDDYFGTPYSNDMWPRHPDFADLPEEMAARKRNFPPLPLIEDDSIAVPDVTGEMQAHFTKMLTERAVDFIRQHSDEPFFVYLAHPMPHVPIFASEDYLGKSGRGLFGDVVMEIDWSVGRINAVLKELGLEKNTLVIFTSDNGPWLNWGNHAGSARPLREGKGTIWDGGVREPCVMKWPAVIPAGRVCSEPAMTIDLLPTLAEVTGAELPGHTIDGLSILPLMKGEEGAVSPHEAYYFYWLHNLEAVRSGEWKLHFPHPYRTMNGGMPGKDGVPGYYGQDSTGYALYNLAEDIGEQENLADRYPEKVQELKALGEQMKLELGQGDMPGTGIREVGRVNEDGELIQTMEQEQ